MKKYRSTITYLTILFLVLNIGIVSAAPIVSSSAETKDGSNRILLCTSQGFIWVTISDTYTLEEPFQSKVSAHHCPFCLSNSIDFDDILQHDNSSNSYFSLQDNKPLFSLSTFHQGNTPLYSLQARAPPVPAV